jgi:hypothetical protein
MRSIILLIALIMIGSTAASVLRGRDLGECDKCNIPVEQGGCKCDDQCACKPQEEWSEDLHGLPKQPRVECVGQMCVCGSGGFSYQINEYRGQGGHTDAKVHGCGGGIQFAGGKSLLFLYIYIYYAIFIYIILEYIKILCFFLMYYIFTSSQLPSE